MPACFEFAESAIISRPKVTPEGMGLPGGIERSRGYQSPLFRLAILTDLVALNSKAAQGRFFYPQSLGSFNEAFPIVQVVHLGKSHLPDLLMSGQIAHI